GPLLASLEAKGQRFEDNLSELPLGCISRKGLWMAIHFESFDFNQEVIKRCLDKGLLTDWFLFAPNALRIAPPLPISNEEIDFATEVILEVCHEMA
ncbi:MAG: aspartate aminotransferase family protein, partial [Bacteroidota bacterium]|nr:aspartate aminotransferase family protein [Bacteroidota bacterium]